MTSDEALALRLTFKKDIAVLQMENQALRDLLDANGIEYPRPVDDAYWHLYLKSRDFINAAQTLVGAMGSEIELLRSFR